MMDTSTAPSVNAIRAELARLNTALGDPKTSDEQCIQLYAARSAIDWMLNCCATPPFEQAMRDNAGDQVRRRRAYILEIAGQK